MLLESFDLSTFDDEKLLSQFPRFPNLTNLQLDVAQIDDYWIHNLPVFPKVRTLRIDNDEITEISLKYFPNQFPSLTDLNLCFCPMIKEVPSCLPNLHYLRLSEHVQSPFIDRVVKS